MRGGTEGWSSWRTTEQVQHEYIYYYPVNISLTSFLILSRQLKIIILAIEININMFAIEIPMIGERLKQIRINNNLTQQVFAARLGTSSGFISEIESGKKLPGSDFLISLRREFSVDLNMFLTGSVSDTGDENRNSPDKAVPEHFSQKLRNIFIENDEIKIRALQALLDVLDPKSSHRPITKAR